MLDRDAQRRIASALFNRAWTLMEQDTRSEAEDAEMLHCALAGDAGDARRWVDLARAACEQVAEDDDRELVLADLQTITMAD